MRQSSTDATAHPAEFSILMCVQVCDGRATIAICASAPFSLCCSGGHVQLFSQALSFPELIRSSLIEQTATPRNPRLKMILRVVPSEGTTPASFGVLLPGVNSYKSHRSRSLSATGPNSFRGVILTGSQPLSHKFNADM